MLEMSTPQEKNMLSDSQERIDEKESGDLQDKFRLSEDQRWSQDQREGRRQQCFQTFSVSFVSDYSEIPDDLYFLEKLSEIDASGTQLLDQRDPL